jgi:hypothetical protein
MEQQQYQPSPMDVGSPTLEALCHDLDMFINELSINTPATATTPTFEEEREQPQVETTLKKRPLSRRPVSKRYNNKDITPLKLDNTLVRVVAY